jgi:hypothetical protein
MYYGFPVLSSRDCLMKEPICTTCTEDDGERIYLIFSPSPILDLSWNISGDIYFSDQDFYYKRKENGVHLQFDCIPDEVFFPWVFLNAFPFQTRRLWSLILNLAISLHFSKFSCNRSFSMLKSLFKSLYIYILFTTIIYCAKFIKKDILIEICHACFEMFLYWFHFPVVIPTKF